MLDNYLKRQNRFLIGLSIVLSVSAIIHAIVLLQYGHWVLALLEFCITLAMCSGITGTVYKNKALMKSLNLMNSIDQLAFFEINDADDLSKNIGDLDFKFHKPSE